MNKFFQKILFLLILLFSFMFVSCASMSPPKSDSDLVLVWAKNLDDEMSSTGNHFISLNWPLLTEKTAYIGTSFGQMHAYDLKNGRPIWQSADGAYQHATAISYKDQIIYGTIEGTLYSRDALSGKLKYRVDLKSPVETQGTLFEGRILFSLRNHEVVCLDPETGKLLWSFKRPTSFLTTLQRMAPITGMKKGKSSFVLVGFADGYLISLRLDDGLVSWETKISDLMKLSDVDIRPQVIKNNIYISAMGSQLKVLSLDGKILRTLNLYPSRTPLVLTDGKILVSQSNGKLTLLDSHLNIINEVTLSLGLPLSNAIHWKTSRRDYYVVASSSGELFFLNSETFKVEKNIYLGHDNSTIYGDIVAFGDYLAFFTSRSRLYVYR